MCAKGVKHLIYKPNYFTPNHLFKYDTLFISFDTEIVPDEREENSIWYIGYDYALGGLVLKEFVDAVGRFSDYDVTDIQKEMERKTAWYYEKNPRNK
jgi:hypothetical protein